MKNSTSNLVALQWKSWTKCAVCCSVLQCVAVCCSVLQWKSRTKCAVCCSVLQWKSQTKCAVCCSVLLFVPVRHIYIHIRVCVAVCVLQCVAVCYSVLQCVAVCCSETYIYPYIHAHIHTLVHIEKMSRECSKISDEMRSVLQRVAVCCSVLQCVAVCCSVLQWHICMYIPAHTHTLAHTEKMSRERSKISDEMRSAFTELTVCLTNSQIQMF